MKCNWKKAYIFMNWKQPTIHSLICNDHSSPQMPDATTSSDAEKCGILYAYNISCVTRVINFRNWYLEVILSTTTNTRLKLSYLYSILNKQLPKHTHSTSTYIDLFTCMPHKFDQFVKQYRQRWYPHTMRNTQNRSHFIHCISVTKNVYDYSILFCRKVFGYQKQVSNRYIEYLPKYSLYQVGIR